jgi:hypothetical protein
MTLEIYISKNGVRQLNQTMTWNATASGTRSVAVTQGDVPVGTVVITATRQDLGEVYGQGAYVIGYSLAFTPASARWTSSMDGNTYADTYIPNSQEPYYYDSGSVEIVDHRHIVQINGLVSANGHLVSANGKLVNGF